MLRKAKSLFAKTVMKSNVTKTVTLVFVLALLFFVYNSFLKEGFECKPSELEEAIHGNDKVMVLFYADWCGHCKKIKPTWEDACKSANKEKKQMVMVDVGGKSKEQKELIDKYNIDGFPTILVFQNGKPEPYSGARTVESFLKEVK
jgi:protein disulfide-isomerase-like protein